ncbi:MAG: OmpA family protein [Hyphomicrobiaceae bacterium]
MTKVNNRPRLGYLGTNLSARAASTTFAALLLMPFGPAKAESLPSNPQEAVAFRLAQAPGQAEPTREEPKRSRERREDRRDAKREKREDRRDARREQNGDRRGERSDSRYERREQRSNPGNEGREQRGGRRDERRDTRRDRREEQRNNRNERREDARDQRSPVTTPRVERRDGRDAPVRVERRDGRDAPVRVERRDGRDAPVRVERRDGRGDAPQQAGSRDGEARGYRATREERRRRRNERRSRGERRAADDVRNMDQLRRGRRVRREGRAEIIEESDSRRIIRSGDRAFITRDENRRMSRFGRASDSRRRPGGGRTTTIIRPNGTRIVTETSNDGHLISRYRIGDRGHRHYLVDNRRTWRKWGAFAAGAAVATGLLVAIDPPRYRGPRDRYIVEYDRADYDDIYDALEAPPVSRLERRYSLDEVLYTPNLRSYMRRVDLSTIHFAFGSWQVNEDEYDQLESLARALGRIIDREADEVFLIEGHTDAVGDSLDNKTLSDRRAEAVANILTEEFDIPPENLVTQGYGEDFLKIDTQAPEEANRRVTVRRITPLLERRSADLRD